MTKPLVVVIGCGKSKRSEPALARDLYTGSLFLMCRRYAEARGKAWGILSARYGFVRPEQELAPYEQKLPRRESELLWWTTNAATGLTYWRGGFDFKVECLAGEDYAAPFCAELESRGITCTRPLVGMGLGKRLCWLKARIAEGCGA
jgi:hypothetical protein